MWPPKGFYREKINKKTTSIIIQASIINQSGKKSIKVKIIHFIDLHITYIYIYLF